MSIKYYYSLLWRTDTKISVWTLSTKKNITFPGEQVFDFCLRIVDVVVFIISGTFLFSLLPLNMPFTHKRDRTERRLTLFQSREVFQASEKNILGSKGGAVVGALASHQCGPGSYPGVNAICGLSLLLVLSLARRGFSPGTPVFPSPQKPIFPNSNSTRNQVDEEPLCGCATYLQIVIYLIFLFLSIYLTLLAYPVEPCGPNKICPWPLK